MVSYILKVGPWYYLFGFGGRESQIYIHYLGHLKPNFSAKLHIYISYGTVWQCPKMNLNLNPSTITLFVGPYKKMASQSPKQKSKISTYIYAVHTERAPELNQNGLHICIQYTVDKSTVQIITHWLTYTL